MKVTLTDKMLAYNLAHKSLFNEDNLICEQRVVLMIHHFSYMLKAKNKGELKELKNKILQDYKENPGKAYFFIHVLKLVDEHLAKHSSE
jgi:hypothetical protein